eukprot:403365479
MFNSSEKQKKLRVLNEKNRKSRIINDKICQQNRAKSALKREVTDQLREINQNNNEKIVLGFSPEQKKQFVTKILDLEVQRGVITDQERHLLNMRGGSRDWRGQLRDYKDTKKVLISTSQERVHKKIQDQRQSMNRMPEMKEQQIQTIKSVFRPEHRDEQLSAIMFPSSQSDRYSIRNY